MMKDAKLIHVSALLGSRNGLHAALDLVRAVSTDPNPHLASVTVDTYDFDLKTSDGRVRSYSAGDDQLDGPLEYGPHERESLIQDVFTVVGRIAMQFQSINVTPAPWDFIFQARNGLRTGSKWSAVRRLEMQVYTCYAQYDTLQHQWSTLDNTGKPQIQAPCLEELLIDVVCDDDEDDGVPADFLSVVGLWFFVIIESFLMPDTVRLNISYSHPPIAEGKNYCADVGSIVHAAYRRSAHLLDRSITLDPCDGSVHDQCVSGPDNQRWKDHTSVFCMRHTQISDSLQAVSSSAS